MTSKKVALVTGYSSFAMYFFHRHYAAYDAVKTYYALPELGGRNVNPAINLQMVISRSLRQLGYGVEVDRFSDNRTKQTFSTIEFFITKIHICEATPLRGI